MLFSISFTEKKNMMHIQPATKEKAAAVLCEDFKFLGYFCFSATMGVE